MPVARTGPILQVDVVVVRTQRPALVVERIAAIPECPNDRIADPEAAAGYSHSVTVGPQH